MPRNDGTVIGRGYDVVWELRKLDLVQSCVGADLTYLGGDKMQAPEKRVLILSVIVRRLICVAYEGPGKDWSL